MIDRMYRSGIFFEQTIFLIFQFADFCVPDISKTNQVRYLKQTPKAVCLLADVSYAELVFEIYSSFVIERRLRYMSF